MKVGTLDFCESEKESFGYELFQDATSCPVDDAVAKHEHENGADIFYDSSKRIGSYLKN